jgi:hypothetical protein
MRSLYSPSVMPCLVRIWQHGCGREEDSLGDAVKANGIHNPRIGSESKFEEWERTGEVQIPPMRDMVDGINHAMLPWWRTIAPAQVRHEVIAAAEAVDRKAETLPAPIVEAILAMRPRSLTRAIHRRQHLDQIERALAGFGR